MNRIRFTLAALLVAMSVSACDAARVTAADNPPPPACNPEFPTMGSGC